MACWCRAAVFVRMKSVSEEFAGICGCVVEFPSVSYLFF